MTERMRKVLFLITELQYPVGGLYRFVTELLPAWRDRVKNKETLFEPIVVSLYDKDLPATDVAQAKEFEEFTKKTGIKVYEAVRGGERVFLLGCELGEQALDALYLELWEKYRIRSEKSSSTGFYKKLACFWHAAELFAEYLVSKGENIFLMDCQDWLAFPAGFLCKEKIKRPLLCRFHSGEFGRSVGNADLNDAPARIEAAALQEADYITAVSVSEAKFEICSLLPLKKEFSAELAPYYQATLKEKYADWLHEQEWKEKTMENFLLLEPEEDSVFITQLVSGVPNGIILDSWKKVAGKKVLAGRRTLEKWLPGMKEFILFIGRMDYRKGINELIDAFASLKRKDVGLVLITKIDEQTKQSLLNQFKKLGVAEQVHIYTDWLREDLKKSLFCASEVIALPSLYEPFGLVTLEALAADLVCYENDLLGPIVIVGNTGGMSEVIKSGVTGLKVRVHDFKLDARELEKVLEIALQEGGLRERITANSAKRVQSPYFNWNHIVLMFFDTYAKAVANFERWHEKISDVHAHEPQCAPRMHELRSQKTVSNASGGERMVKVEEYFGVSAGKVWHTLKKHGPLGIAQLKKKSSLSDSEVYSALGWLAREGKIKIIGEKPLLFKYALNE